MWCSLLWKYILVFEKWSFSFDRSNIPHVTNILDLRYFCQHNPLFCLLNLIRCRYWSLKRNIYFLVNIFVRHTFPLSNSSIKTKTVLTMTDKTESTELKAFKRQKDGWKVTVKISLCICVVLSWDDYEIFMMCLLVVSVYWHKSLQFVKNITVLPCLSMVLLAVSMIKLCSTTF